ncbi:MAG: hypothetical protein ACRDT0_08700 [Pseudonocardiaceae bacterium]
MTPTTTIGGPSASVLYSGSEEAFVAHRATLEAFGGATTYLGADPGRAAAYDIALLDVFWTAMIGYVHAMALADTEDITASDLAPHVQGIVALLPDRAVAAGFGDDGFSRLAARPQHLARGPARQRPVRRTPSKRSYYIQRICCRKVSTCLLQATGEN